MPSTSARSGSRILVVESPAVRNLIGAILEKERYAVILEDVGGGIGILERQAGAIDLVITNDPWPFETHRPGVPMLYISGAPDREFLAKRRSGRFAFLQKPFRYEALVASVRTLLKEVAGL